MARCAANPTEGPDRRIYFIDMENKTISSVTSDGNDLRVELAAPSGCVHFYEGWKFWNGNLVCIDCEDNAIKALEHDSGETRLIADVDEDDRVSLDPSFAISPDGRWLIYSQLDRAGSDRMLVESFQ